jgi:DNA end-binding protein Ku
MEALQASVEAARAHRPGTHIATPDGAGKASAKRTPKRGSSGTAADLGDSSLSKSELLARAAELGIPGRSKMTRDELETAVAGGTKPAKRRKAS